MLILILEIVNYFCRICFIFFHLCPKNACHSFIKIIRKI